MVIFEDRKTPVGCSGPIYSPPPKLSTASIADFASSTSSGTTNKTTTTRMANNGRCFMEFTVPETGKSVRVEFELFRDKLPKACANFAQLCEGAIDKHGRKMCYKDSVLHEIIPDWVLVGGDFVNNNGTGGQSIYEEGDFEDESFTAVDYNEPGLLCMLSHGPNTNSSIFFVTLKPAEWLSGLYVAFGKVTSDLEALKSLAGESGSPSGIPKQAVKISACGRLD